jgi:phosphopantetheinyl transferase
MYLFLSDKNAEEKSLLWEKIKSQKEDEYKALIESLSDYVSSSGKKNLEERLAAATLLYTAVCYLKNRGELENVGALKKGEHGKPYLEGGDAKISISHSDDGVALAVSKDREIGVDMENEIDPERAKRLEKRFFREEKLSENALENDSPSEKISGENVKAYSLKNGEFVSINLLPTDGSFTSKWTVCEAIMKCDGRGFSALHDISTLAEKMEIISFIRESGGRKTYISIALG